MTPQHLSLQSLVNCGLVTRMLWLGGNAYIYTIVSSGTKQYSIPILLDFKIEAMYFKEVFITSIKKPLAFQKQFTRTHSHPHIQGHT